MEFAQACVDGDVPVFWTESGDEMTAGLVFRVGRADESLARGGITHLIEHLALYSLGASGSTHYNGQVDAVTTTFVTRGGPEEVTGFFKAVCAGLRELPVERLETERQVLRTEADQRRPAIAEPLLIARYGADTYGLPAYPEFGIGMLQPDELRSWTRRYFTRGNAAMWIAGGPPPGGLHLDLPDGPAMPPPTPARTESRTPGWVNAPVPGLGWSGLVQRSREAQVYASILDRRLRQELRHNQGLAYSPAVSYIARDQDLAHVVAATDGLPDVHAALVQAFVGELERLAATAVTDDELHTTLEKMRANMGTSRGAAQRAASAAHYTIMGKPVATVASWREGLAAVSAAEVQRVAEEAFGSSLFVLPPKREPHRLGFTHLGGSDGTAVAGRRIRSADYPLDQARLVIGEEGVSLVQGKAVDTVRYARCAALLTWPDGGRLLIGRDAVSVSIEPTLWRLKDHAAHLGEKVGAERSVAMPYRPSERVPGPWTGRPTRLAGRVLVAPTTAFLAGTVPIGVLLTLLALLVPGNGGVFVLVLVLPAMAAGGNVAKRAGARLLARAAQRNAERH